MKSDIESRCKQYEAKNDGAGMKAYLEGLLKAEPKPEGWNESVEKLVNSWLAKARSLVLKNRIQDYLRRNIAEIQKILDTRAVEGKYRDYKEVHKLVDAAVAEMKLYDPGWGNLESAWESSMRSVRRVMTTAGANAAITAAKAELGK